MTDQVKQCLGCKRIQGEVSGEPISHGYLSKFCFLKARGTEPNMLNIADAYDFKQSYCTQIDE